MVTIRLSRGGAKKRPFYQIVVADSRSPRDGRFIERVGDVRSPRCAPDTVGRIPGAALGDLVLVVASRQRKRRTVDTRRIARERRLGTVWCPIGVASHRLVMAAGDCHQDVRARLRTSRIGGSRHTALV